MKNKENDKFQKVPINSDEDQCKIINKNKEKCRLFFKIIISIQNH